MDMDRINNLRNLAADLSKASLNCAADPSVALAALSMAAASIAAASGITLEKYCAATDQTAEIIYRNFSKNILN